MGIFFNIPILWEIISFLEIAILKLFFKVIRKFCKWVYFFHFQKNGYIANGYIPEI